MQYIYLVRPKEYLCNGEDIYKIGKSKQKRIYNRVSSYQVDSELILTCPVINCDKLESKLKFIFKNTFLNVKGTEYFKGDVSKMIFIIINEIHLELKTYTKEEYCEIIDYNRHYNEFIYCKELPIDLKDLEQFIIDNENKWFYIKNETTKNMIISLSIILFLCNYYDDINYIITHDIKITDTI